MIHRVQFRSKGLVRRAYIGVVIGLAGIATFGLRAYPQVTDRRTFKSAEEAATALADACRANNELQLLAILGPQGKELISSGDEVADKLSLEKFVRAFEEAYELVPDGDGRQILKVGAESWSLPVPIVMEGQSWYFDTVAGGLELISRRIESNELSAVKVCRLYVELQREYASKSRGPGRKSGEYAQKLRSDPGTNNGLYWEQVGFGERSPAGALFELAAQEGYGGAGGRPKPFHGYYFRVLTEQGKAAPGGARSYFNNSDTGIFAERKMTEGFALVAYPAKYQTSGKRTFIVNQDGIVYQQDLGDDTQRLADQMTAYNPDPSWSNAD